MNTASPYSEVIFEVIPGGLCFEDDIPAPDKPIEEWTEAEVEQYHNALWKAAEPGSVENPVKVADLTADTINTVVEALETIRTVFEAEASETGFQREWPYLTADYLLDMLKRRQRFEAYNSQERR